jgi:hypothetical protein
VQTNAKTSKRAARQDFLNTFAAPRPQRWLIAALVPVNRVLCLGGIPGLRRIPGLNRVPGIRGLADVVRVDLPSTDRQRLLAAVSGATTAFITPNHPEFFTDWMLDKEICTRVAPLTANWATHEVVNGMGRLMQRFWLANNLIAQIPGGGGGAAGKAYSVDWAARGHAVLLHPEGQVGWHNDYVGPLFPGVVEMAVATLAQLRAQGIQRDVYIAPIVWKLKFERNEEARLMREMRYVERKLALRVEEHVSLPERVHEAHAMLLQRDATKWNANISLSAPYWIAQARLLTVLSEQLRQRVGALGGSLLSVETGGDSESATKGYRALTNAAERHLRELEPSAEVRDARDLAQELRRILRLRPEMYPGPALTQEQIAECIKRLRNDYCFGALRDNVNRFMPQPAGARVAYVRVPPPLNISQALARDTAPHTPTQEALLTDLRARMQLALNEINRELHARGRFNEYPNPLAG